MPTEIEELVTFLHDKQLQVREIALENLVQFSPAGANSQQHIFKYDNFKAIEDLKELAHEKKGKTVNEAITILSNLCDDSEFRKLIVDDVDFIKFIIETLSDPKNLNAELMCIFLSNLAKSDQILKIFEITVNIREEQKEILKSDKAIDYLLDLFVKGADREINKYAVYDYLAYFFADLSRFTKGREYFVTEQEYDNVIPLSKLLVFTEKYNAKVRREGVASTIKNSLFDIERHIILLEEPINLLSFILSPIALPNNKGLSEDEIFDLPDELQLLDEEKKTEPLQQLIAVHLESLLLLCATRRGRDFMRSKSVYPVVRELHKENKDEIICELCDRLVQMLMRDEGQILNEGEEMNEIKEMLQKVDEEEREREEHNADGDGDAKVDENDNDSDSDEEDGRMIVVC